MSLYRNNPGFLQVFRRKHGTVQLRLGYNDRGRHWVALGTCDVSNTPILDQVLEYARNIDDPGVLARLKDIDKSWNKIRP